MNAPLPTVLACALLVVVGCEPPQSSEAAPALDAKSDAEVEAEAEPAAEPAAPALECYAVESGIIHYDLGGGQSRHFGNGFGGWIQGYMGIANEHRELAGDDDAERRHFFPAVLLPGHHQDALQVAVKTPDRTAYHRIGKPEPGA